MKKSLFLTIALLCAVAQGAWAQTEVSSESALTTAISGGTTISVKLTENIALSNYVDIPSSKTVTIDLNGNTLNRGLSSLTSLGNVIRVQTGSTLTIKDSKGDNSGKITGGYDSDGGGICIYGTVNFEGGTITGCQATNGGAVYVVAGGSFTMTGGVITGNTASYCGGVIYNKGTFNFNSGTVSGSAPYGGAVYNTGSFTMAGGTISNSSSTTGGGGGLVNIGTVEISGGTFSENTAKTDGGAIWNGNSGSAHGTLTITGGTITTNTAKNYGGGIWNENEVTISNCEISSNTGDDGGGIYNKADGNMTINSGTTFSGNTSENHSGGAINNHGKLTVNGGSFTSNTAKNNGGAIGNFDSGVLTINGGSFTGNSVSTYYGGGVYIGSGTFNLSGSVTITSNTANSKTDNLYLYSDNIINVTGALTGSSIGVTLEGYNRDFTSGYGTYNGSTAPSTFFITDVSGTEVSLNGNEAKLTISSGVTYVERSWEGGNTDGHVVSKTKRCDSYSTYNGEKDLYSGWYLLSGSKSYDFRLVVHGTNTYFILEDGSNIEFKKGIHIDDPRTLTIYGQSGGTGKLRATGSGDAANAAIGGNKDQMSGHFIIHGGTVEASSSENNAAAIGGGDGSSSGMQSITIYGGTVTATGKSSGAGIGSGQENSTVPSITIYGGNVTATGGNYAAGIGGGEECSGGTIKIYGGTINATGGEYGAGIGGGEEGGASTITIYNGDVTANGGNKGGAGIGGGDQGKNGTITIYNGTVNATGGSYGSGIGAGEEDDDAGRANCTVTIYGGDVTATAGDYGAGIGGYASATVNIHGGTVKAHGMNEDNINGIGIGVRREGGVLNFHMTGGDVTADVKIHGSNSSTDGGGAGIGGDYNRNVELHITIDGGTLNATGGPGGAGIGGGCCLWSVFTVVVGGDVNSGSDITINGGNVTATSGDTGGAGIGAGYGGNFHGTLTINGGNVTAKGNSGGAGIGGGRESHFYGIGGNGGNVIINGGKVTAYAENGSSGNNPSQAIGHGRDDETSGDLTIADNMCVKNDDGTTTYGKDERVTRCRDNGKRIIEVCEHTGHCTPNGVDGHTVSCTYCKTSGNEAHTYGTGLKSRICTRCEYVMSDPKTITIYEANSDGTGYGTATTHQVQYGTNYTLPECSSVPNNMWFVGWKETTDAPSSFEAESSEFSSLKAAGDSITVTTDVTYYARYHTTVWPGGGNGTAGDPYLISTEEDWNEFVNAVSYKNFDFGGRYLKLTKNISVTEMVGTSSNRFRGTFDGDGHTLTVDYNTSARYTAPFRFVGSATIKNLHVSGTISTSAKFASGLIGDSNGSNANVTNCRSSVAISSTVNGDGTHGGFVANITSGTVNINGCIFDGSMTGSSTTNCGGFVGWISGTAANLTDCLFMPTSLGLSSGCYTFVRRAERSSISNCFYTSALGTAQGTQAYTVTNGQPSDMTLDYGSGTHYGEITAYSFNQGNNSTARGLLYDGKLYTGGSTSVTFTPEANFSFTALKANEETLTANSDGSYTVTMNNAGVTITADEGTYELTLYDGTADPTNNATIYKNRGRIANVTIDGRTLYKDYNWNTLCLPFDVSAEKISANSDLSGATIMELDTEGWYDSEGNRYDEEAEGRHQTSFASDGTLYLYFLATTSIDAGVPCLVKWDGNTSFTSPTFYSSYIESSSPRTVTSADNKVNFIGNYDPVNLAAGQGTYYLGSNNQLYYPSADRTMNAFRAYFTVDLDNGGPSAVRAFVLNFGDDGETTGIVDVEYGILNVGHSTAATGWYTLDGRKLQAKPTQKGVYIYNGKKVAIK